MSVPRENTVHETSRGLISQKRCPHRNYAPNPDLQSRKVDTSQLLDEFTREYTAHSRCINNLVVTDWFLVIAEQLEALLVSLLAC